MTSDVQLFCTKLLVRTKKKFLSRISGPLKKRPSRKVKEESVFVYKWDIRVPHVRDLKGFLFYHAMKQDLITKIYTCFSFLLPKIMQNMLRELFSLHQGSILFWRNNFLSDVSDRLLPLSVRSHEMLLICNGCIVCLLTYSVCLSCKIILSNLFFSFLFCFSFFFSPLSENFELPRSSHLPLFVRYPTCQP